MANCNSLLRDYNDAIKLNSSDEDKLRRSRTALRNRIKEKIKERHGLTPKFFGQGSFYTQTIIKPEDGDYDVDDGVYFLYDETPPETPTTFHQRIVKAVDGYTEASPTDKDPCVRVSFKAGYHIDLPIYRKVGDAAPELAHKRDGWLESDPKAFSNWLKERVDSDGQLRRIIRYLKGWKDHRAGSLPSGLVLTILACDHVCHDDRDDVALHDTLVAIHDALNDDFSCKRPTTPVGEDLLAGTSETAKTYTLDRLDSFVRSASEAIELESRRQACKKWQLHLGDRLSCPVEDSLENARTFEKAAFVRSSGRSA